MLDVRAFDEAIDCAPGPGHVLGGKYRLEHVIGRGGMGVVFLARSMHLDASVAIKVVARDPTPALRRRLLTEARAMARIKSDHVVRVLDVEGTSSTPPYIVMEYLDGEPLSDVVRRIGPVPVPEAVRWVLQACEGLAAAHQHGIVHRDLKPANLFLERCVDGSRRIKVLDFGISRIQALDPVGVTTHPIGSPMYMAPEQLVTSSEVDARTDIWGLGIVLYELLTHRTPFDGRSMLELALRLRDTSHSPAHLVRPEVSEALSNVIDRCLEKRPENRWSTVAELASALARFGAPDAAASAARVRQIASSAPVERASFSGDSSTPRAVSQAQPARRHEGSTMVTTLATPVRRALGPALIWASLAAVIISAGSAATHGGRHPEVVTKDVARVSSTQEVSRAPEVTTVLPPALAEPQSEAVSPMLAQPRHGGPTSAITSSTADPAGKHGSRPGSAKNPRGTLARRSALPIGAPPTPSEVATGASHAEDIVRAKPPAGSLPIDRALSF